MHVLQNGLPKSGNYWLYSILNLTLDAAGVERKGFIEHHPIQPIAENWLLSNPDQATMNVLDIEPGIRSFRIGSYYKEPIANLKEYIDANRLIWTHSRYITDSEEVYDSFDKIVYIIRDPRDVAISQAYFALTPYRLRTHPVEFATSEDYLKVNFIRHLSGWTQHVGSHLLAPPRKNLHYVFYERLKERFDEEYLRLIEFLELDVSASQRNEIREAVSVQSMRKKSKDHVRKGSAGGWRKSLSAAQVRQARFIAGGILQELSYPLDRQHASLPALPEHLNTKRIKRSMQKGMITRGLNFVRHSLGHLKAPTALRVKDGATALDI